MKNILFISPEYPPETGMGGIGTYVYEMATAIKKYDQSISVTVLSVSFEKNRRRIEEGIEIIRVRANKQNPLGVHWAISYWLLKNYDKYDFIEDEIFGGYAILAKVLLGKKYHYAARLHGTSYEVYTLERQRGVKRFISRAILNFFEKFITKRSSLIIANSSLMGVYSFFLWDIDFSRMNILPLPIRLKDIGGECKNSLENVCNGEYFLFYGSVQKKKGSEVLKKIIERVLLEYPEKYFVIMGNDRKNLAGFFKGNNRVIFLGYVGEKEKLYSVIRGAKIVILPSQFESFLYTAVESISLAVPTVITRNCGVAEHLKIFSDYNNIVSDQNNADEFMSVVGDIIRNYENAKIKTLIQREEIIHCFEPSIIVKKHIKLLNEKYGK